MSVFGSLISSICSDYFGDEFGVPLPPIKRTMIHDYKAKAAASKEPMSKNGGNTSPKSLLGKPPLVALAFAPKFDGLGFYETLVIC